MQQDSELNCFLKEYKQQFVTFSKALSVEAPPHELQNEGKKMLTNAIGLAIYSYVAKFHPQHKKRCSLLLCDLKEEAKALFLHMCFVCAPSEWYRSLVSQDPSP